MKQEPIRIVVDAETWMAWLEAMRADAGRPDYPLVLTPDLYRTWKAHSGNAKARRRWRRRNLPNPQRDTLATCGNGHRMWRTWKPGDKCPACGPTP